MLRYHIYLSIYLSLHRLVHAITFSSEALVFGRLAIDALRATAAGLQEVGLAYGLAEKHHAFTTSNGARLHLKVFTHTAPTLTA